MNAKYPKRISLTILPQLRKDESEKKKKKEKKILPKPIGHPISSDVLSDVLMNSGKRKHTPFQPWETPRLRIGKLGQMVF